jgi:hypothetical protein
MRTLLTTPLFALGFVVLAGCAARSPEMYRDDTRKLLETRSDTIRECYDAHLQKDRVAAAKIVVRFKVSSETGQITDAKVDETQSTGEKKLGECVVKAIEGLTIDPVDERDGDATFSWEFAPKS